MGTHLVFPTGPSGTALKRPGHVGHRDVPQPLTLLGDLIAVHLAKLAHQVRQVQHPVGGVVPCPGLAPRPVLVRALEGAHGDGDLVLLDHVIRYVIHQRMHETLPSRGALRLAVLMHRPRIPSCC